MERPFFAREIGRIRHHQKSGDELASRYDAQIFVIYFKIGVESGRRADYMTDKRQSEQKN